MPAWDIVIHRPVHSGKLARHDYYYIVNREEWKESDGYYNLNKYPTRGEAEFALRKVMGLGADPEYNPELEIVLDAESKHYVRYRDRKGIQKPQPTRHNTLQEAEVELDKLRKKFEKENAKLRAPK